MKKQNVLTAMVLIATALLGGGVAHAATYYVAKTGSDTNSCTAATSTSTARLTIKSGLTCLHAGDTLYIRTGTYAEQINSNTQTIPTGTSWSAPVTIAAQPGETVTLRPISGSVEVLGLAHSYIQYLIFDGLILDGNKRGTCPINDGCGATVVSLWGGANRVRIQNCELKNSMGQGITIYPGNGYSSDYNELLRSKIYNNGSNDFDHGLYMNTNNNLIDGNEFYDNAGTGIQKYPRGDNNVIRNNKSHNNAAWGKRGPGISISGGSGDVVFNNIAWRNSGGIVVRGGASNTKVYNNTVYSNTRTNPGYIGVEVQTSTGTVIKNNIVYQNNGIYDYTASAVIANNLLTDPKFVSSSSGDFHLLPGSAAIDTGLTLSEVPKDYEGNPRPSGAYDIGADEYAPTMTNSSPPSAPTGLKVVAP